MKGFVYKSFSRVSGDRVAWSLSNTRLRILCYHGICRDDHAAEPWMPSYFVTRSAFESQLQYLCQHASVLPLSEAVRRLREGTLPDRPVSVTFDDGYANNLYVAAPLLEKYSVPATIFLATSYVETGDWYPFLKLKLVRLRFPMLRLLDYKSNSVDAVHDATAQYWSAVQSSCTPEQRDALRPLSVREVRAADTRLIEFGAHSHTHGIARNEAIERRRQEVRISVRRVREWTDRPVHVYSYPNGESGDFGDPEKQTLREEGISAAVTGIPGGNSRRSDLLELKRYPLAMYHDEDRFRAEVTGFRTMLLSIRGGRVQ